MIYFLQEDDKIEGTTKGIFKDGKIDFSDNKECTYSHNGYKIKFEDSGRPYIDYSI